MFNKMKNKIYHTDGTVLKLKGERDKIFNTQIPGHFHGTGTSI